MRYAFGKGFCWFLRCAVTLHPSMHTVRRFPETFLVYGVVGDDWQHLFYALFRYSSSAENSIFLQGDSKVLLLSSSPPGGWLSGRVENLFLSPAFFLDSNVRTWRHTQRFLWRHRHSRVPFFRGSLAADTVILPCFRFRKEILGSAVEGTPKGVQKRYARLSNLLYGFHVTNYVLGIHPQKTYFSHSCQTLTGK